MPWQSGEFVRSNNQYNGEDIWQNDRDHVPPFKIVADRHDFHDQDLAQGINACLNRDGSNKMQAALQMNGYEIVTIGKPSAINSAAQHGQTLKTATLSAQNVLSLNFQDPSNSAVTVDLSALAANVGAGSVTEVRVGTGLETDTGTGITTSGTISLRPTTVAAGSYTRPSITVDQYGRISQVAERPPDAIGVESVAVSEPLTKSGDINVIMGLRPATSQQSGYMSASDKDKLDSLNPSAIGVHSIQAQLPLEATGVDHVQLTMLSATQSRDGYMSKEDKLTLDNLGAGNNLSTKYYQNAVDIQSSTGNDARIATANFVSKRAGVIDYQTAGKIDALPPADELANTIKVVQRGTITVSPGVQLHLIDQNQDDVGQFAIIDLWVPGAPSLSAKGGVFGGDITSSPPADQSATVAPDGFVWFEI